MFVGNMLWLQPVKHTSILNPITKHFLSIWDRFKPAYYSMVFNPLITHFSNFSEILLSIQPGTPLAPFTLGPLQTSYDYIS